MVLLRRYRLHVWYDRMGLSVMRLELVVFVLASGLV